MDTLRDKLERERRELLDLSLRNTLLNYRKLKSKGAEVVDELPEEIYRILVLEGKTMSFLPLPDEEAADDQADFFSEIDAPQFDQPPEEENGVARRHLDTKLQTHYRSARLQRRLLNSYYTARSSIEEHGVHTLFLALGMLRWYEAEQSEEERLAPLILIPVELTRSSVRARFRIRHTGDDLGTNLSLKQKLRIEYQIDFPSIDPDEDVLVRRYFDQVAAAVQQLPRWEVDASAVHLGFFYFTKLMMYEDLDAANWPEEAQPTEHPLLVSLLEEGFRDSESVADGEESLDDVIGPMDTFHIWDADSSQTESMLDVRLGKNLVVQGPPGTGKSQTITNLIAEAAATDKKVLFVAEKMAALEVVKRRLDNAGLGEMCLELHSHRTNRRAVLEELKKTLSLGRPRRSEDIRAAEALGTSRRRLNEYCQALNLPIGESGVSPFRAYGELLRLAESLSDLDPPHLDDSKIRFWAKADFERRVTLTREMEALLRAVGVPAAHAFWGSRRHVFLPAEEDLVRRASGQAAQALAELEVAAKHLAQELKLEVPKTDEDLRLALQAAHCAVEAPPLEGFAVQDPAWSTQKEHLQRVLGRGRRLSDLHREHDSGLLPESWEEDVLPVRRVLAASGKKWWRWFSSEYRRARRECQGLFKQEPPKEVATWLGVLDAILDAQRLTRFLAENRELVVGLLGRHWRGYESDWELIPAVTDYLARLHEDVSKARLPGQVVQYLSTQRSREELEAALALATERSQRFGAVLENLFELIELDETVRFEGGDHRQVAWSELAEIISTWESDPKRLQDMVRYNHLADAMLEEQLDGVLGVAETWSQAASGLGYLLERAWYGGLVEEAMKSRPSLAAFDSETHRHSLEQFRELDRQLVQRNRAVVARKHWDGLPKQGAHGQVGVLRREFEKRRRHLPIRRLMIDAGRAIQATKPVFMMSPLSVAAYIPPGSLSFDLVIFDEASQVTPVDSYGAILRGKQAVVVGDSKQLPPTPFFEKLGDPDEEEAGSASDLESILGLFVAQNAPQRMLRWHYRSRHESLIAVSNQEFYDNQLVVFPSPQSERNDIGLAFRHLPGAFYRPE